MSTDARCRGPGPGWMFGLCALLWAGEAAADRSAQARTALNWVREAGAESCIAPAELGKRVERLVGPVLVPASAGEIAIEGRIAPAAHGYIAHIAVSDADGRMLGQRVVKGEGEDCRRLDEQLAFVIAVAIDPDAALAELPGEFAQDGEPGAELLAQLQADPPEPAPFARSSPLAPKVRQLRPDSGLLEPDGEPLRMHAAAGPALGLALAGDAGPGISVELGLGTSGWTHRVGGALWLAQARSIDAQHAASIELLSLHALSCPRLWERAAFGLFLCAGAAVGRLSVQPRGFSAAAQARWMFGPMLEARLQRRLSAAISVVVGAGVCSLWPRYRTSYELGGVARELYRTAPVSGQGRLSLDLHF